MTKKSVSKYQANNTLRNDKKGLRFEPGDVVTSKDFPAAVIENWLEIGDLIPLDEQPETEGD